MKPSRKRILQNIQVLLALVGMGVVMPLLDIFGNQPQFFVAKDHRSFEVFIFGLVLTVLPALAVFEISTFAWIIHENFEWIVYHILFAGLGLLLALAVLRKLPLELDWVIWLIAGVIALLLLLAAHYWKTFRTGLRFLSITPLAAFLIFISTSPSANIIWQGEAPSVPVPGIANPAPIVLLVFDEFPIASLLAEDATINAERFPNFARLADQSYWFRNNTAVFPWTASSITTALTGNLLVEKRAFNSSVYPHNLFTLLGDNYQMKVHEEITRLCPRRLCDLSFSPEQETWVETTAGSRLLSSFIDAGVVYAQAVSPPSVRARLPGISQSMGGFLGQDMTADPKYEGKDLGVKTALAQKTIFENLIASIRPTSQPTLYFAHIVFPHYPWALTPSGHTYTSETYQYDDLQSIPGLLKDRDHWGKDVFLVRQGFQRHLMQVGYADRLLGEFIDRMQNTRMWDRSLIVVIADHGVSFIPNQTRRGSTTKNKDEIYRVPFFLKVPGQEKGVISDEVVTLLDLMPTLIDILDIEIDWSFAGRSLFGDSPPPFGRPVIEYPVESVSATIDGLMAVVHRNASIFDQIDEGWFGLAAVGEYGNLVGKPVSELGSEWSRDFPWTVDQTSDLGQVDFSSSYVPVLLTGTLKVPEELSAPGMLLVAVNGVVAGVGGGFDCQADVCQFSALLAEEILAEGNNRITVLMSNKPSKPLSRDILALP